MKFHAPRIVKPSRRAAAAVLAIGACLLPASAWALIVPMPPRDGAADICPLTQQQQAGFAALPVTKTEAILGGARSRLEEMRAQQASAAAVSVEPAAMLAPSSGPASPIAAPCTAPLGAALPSLISQPVMAQHSAPLPWTSQRAAVSVITRPPLASGLLLPPVNVSKPDVFGSVALSIGRTPLDDKWHRAQAVGLSSRNGPWRRMLGEARGLDQGGKIEMVNRWVNSRVRFADDIARFKTADRWATAVETLRAEQGDCEDYAIAKMKLLEAAGVARSDMFLVIAKDLVRRADHALLVVRNGERLVVLDNNTDLVVDAAAMQDYRPVMSYSAGRAWIHGYAVEPAQLQPAPVRIAALGG